VGTSSPDHSRRWKLDVTLLLALGHGAQQLTEAVAHGVLAAERDEDELEAHLAKLREGDRVRVVEPLERARPVEREARVRETLPDRRRPLLERRAVGCRELAPDHVRHARIEVAQRPIDRQLHASRALRRVDRRQPVGPGDDHEVLVAQVVSHGPRHA
jgi:hypothetical protein